MKRLLLPALLLTTLTAFRVRVSGVANGAGGYGIRPYEVRATGIDPGTSANGRLAGEQCSPLQVLL